jgi:hypothetical protein
MEFVRLLLPINSAAIGVIRVPGGDAIALA